MAGIGIPEVTWLVLIAAKVLIARYYIVLICGFIVQFMMSCFVLSNYVYLLRKLRRGAAQQNTPKVPSTASRSNDLGKVHNASSGLAAGKGATSSVIISPSSVGIAEPHTMEEVSAINQ
jgi:hypothetical protein